MADSDKNKWVDLASEAFEQSTTYIDTNYRRQWDDGIRYFNSEHEAGSKYHSGAFKYRSKIFRPKTRSTIRNNEPAAAAAFFNNQDLVSIEPNDINNPMQIASAEVNKSILNYRLEKTIPWFQICMGAFQDAMTTGVCCSYQYWDYQEKDGKVLVDKPCIELIPVENLRIHPASDWVDPIKTSPYLIHMIPMMAFEVKKRMNIIDPKTNAPKWRQLSDGQIRSGVTDMYDITRAKRNMDREDAYDIHGGGKLKSYDIVWVHRNFFKIDGKDYVFYTLSTHHLLTTPKPIEEMYFHGERPYVLGNCIIESHKLYPSGIPQLGQNVQREINEIANQRLDNVKLALNKRYLVKRGSGVDLNSLLRNVAGGVTLVNDTSDVSPVDFNDVTGSSYNEQDRLNIDFDELTGNFSPSSIQTNRQMNETVGGMAMLRGASNVLTEYLVRTFAETFVQPVMRQLVQLEQAYETDLVVLSIAQEKAQQFMRYGMNPQIDEILNQKLSLNVNVGLGSTDPQFKVQSFMFAISTIQNILAFQVPGLNKQNIIQEIFSRLGYKNGERFIDTQADPEKEQMMQQIQQLQQQMQQMELEQKVGMQVTQLKEQSKMQQTMVKEQNKQQQTALVQQSENQRAMLGSQTELRKAAIGGQVEMQKAIINARSKNKKESK